MKVWHLPDAPHEAAKEDPREKKKKEFLVYDKLKKTPTIVPLMADNQQWSYPTSLAKLSRTPPSPTLTFTLIFITNSWLWNKLAF